MPGPDAPVPTRSRAPGARLALAFAGAAAAACWNPFAAPVGLVVGIAAVALAWRARRRAAARGGLPLAALALAMAAVVASAAVLAFTAGSVGTELPGAPVLKARSPEELERALGEAAARTRAERERAAAELERLGGLDGGAPPAAPRDRR